ncbi:LOW QUALITY PROTEIN: contactin-associated protein-like 5 [Brienomyrus brachyistius]|uniref:LOW QUALITY PROTEIN: contactin-associated protein-like 5 n=1 Tax=Brienomyrus brachyistius TaxID=42636 RepID=UPI0020B3D9D2|nr:LOW QUALITY PROTEIN: contactin-associated protein-like 5 [Brienomyrus brachyistius]
MGSPSPLCPYALPVTLMVFSSALAANNYNCDGPLGAAMPATSFEGSSQLSDGTAPHFARLNKREGTGGWSPQHKDRDPWLQLDLRDRLEVTGVATQGRSGSSDWVTSFRLLASDTGRAWTPYQQEDGVTTFQGNTDAEGVTQHRFPQSIRTRFLRFVPLSWNPSGWVGLRVEVYGCMYKSDVADFDGRSSLLYRFNQKSMSTVKDVISLRFKSQKGEGVLVHGEGQRGDHVTLELHRGKLALHLNLDDAKLHPGGGHTSLSLGSLLDDQRWHTVLVERFNKQVNFSVDGQTQHLRTGGADDSLDVDYELSFGGIPLPGKPGTFLRKNFQGCMENLYYNGVNVIDLAKRRKPQIYSVGNVTFSCSEAQPVAASFLSSRNSFLLLPAEPAKETLSVHFQFRTWNRDGLLLFVQLGRGPGCLALRINGGQLRLTHQHSALQKSEISTSDGVNDGLWHSISVSMKNQQVSLVLDGESPLTVELGEHGISEGSFFFGGCPPAPNNFGCRNPTLAFQGCLRHIFLNNKAVDLFHVQQGMLGNFSHLQIDGCGIRDRCTPSFCEHGGRCTQSWSSFHCDCSGTGYTGPTCHNSIYEPSCEAYRQTGSSSGYFSIDPDGSGPLESTKVYCNMTEDKVWTVVAHNITEPVRVQGSSLQRPHVMHFNYSASPEQLRSLVAMSEHCQQEVEYRCRKSRLFNTWDGTLLSWWLDRSGDRHTYWGGALPGVQQCSCSLEENCLDMNYFCNCDADRESWANDTGVLSYKDHLPVSEISIGDTNRTDSEAIYRIGPLRCHGDRFFWNAASFYQESSYLHFPTFQAELSADISFYFKTTAPSGVFLENMGIKDFFRVELSSPSAVTFTFNVGNGPVALVAKSHVPLNDKQWHYVRAERHVKGASLQVDQLPLHYSEAPPDGHLRMQLSSQLFVGGTASRQRGFLGCVRALTMNGLTLDLEERAKMTPGVSSGCPGHCSGHANLCHNRGRCMESNNGYTCDCTHSAYRGPHCKEEVSLSFELGSSVTYTFQEPFSVMRNRSAQSPTLYAESGKSRENVAFSFMTSHCPAMLLAVSTFYGQYMAIILAQNGSLQIWYRLDKDRKPDVFTPVPANFADGQLHSVRIHREGKDIHVQMDKETNQKYTLSLDTDLNTIKALTLGRVAGSMGMDEEVQQAASRGFVGCLSSVQFNHVAPLKAALLNRGSSLVSVRGRLEEASCGLQADRTKSHSHSDSEKVDRGKEPLANAVQRDSAVIGGVIAAVVFITLCVVVAMSRFLYQHRQAQRATGLKEKEQRRDLEQSRDREQRRGLEQRRCLEQRRGLEPAYRPDLSLHSAVRDTRKEYYI